MSCFGERNHAAWLGLCNPCLVGLLVMLVSICVTYCASSGSTNCGAQKSAPASPLWHGRAPPDDAIDDRHAERFLVGVVDQHGSLGRVIGVRLQRTSAVDPLARMRSMELSPSRRMNASGVFVMLLDRYGELVDDRSVHGHERGSGPPDGEGEASASPR